VWTTTAASLLILTAAALTSWPLLEATVTTDTAHGLTRCAAHTLPIYPTQAAADAEVIRRKTRAAISGSAPPQVVAQECTGGGWHVHRPIKPVRAGVLTDREPCRAYARRLHQHDGDWRINSGYIASETVPRDNPCGVCQKYGRCGQVHISWSPAGRASTDQVDACTGCAPEYLQSVVSVDAGDCDVHTDLIDVEVRRVA